MESRIHTGAYAVLWKEGKVALVLKSNGAYIGCWDLPGGKIVQGEEPEQTVHRKVEEETGLKLKKDMPMLGIFSNSVQHDKTEDGAVEELFHIGLVYQGYTRKRAKIKTDIYAENTLGAKWFSVSELKSLNLTPFAEKCIFMVKAD